jgi:Flp pilus assembly protein TadB
VRAVETAAATLRERAHLEADVKVQATQARISAAVVAVTPVVFVMFAAATDHRTSAFLASPAGVLVAAIAFGLDGLGVWWMVRLTRRVAQWA